MVYSSLLFIYGFLPVSVLLFYITPKKLRELTLLFLSIVFCGMISLYFLIFMLAFTALNYGFSHLISRLRKNEKAAAVPLTVGIIIDLAALIVFRTEYFDWLYRLIKAPEGFFPVGISFFSLAAVGTLIDIYKGRIKAEKNIVRFSLYFMFFPRLIMGPLLRYGVFRRILDNRTSAIVIAPSVNVKTTPEAAAKDAFLIHEGTKVEITDDSMNDWKCIHLANGKEGWVSTKVLVRI